MVCYARTRNTITLKNYSILSEFFISFQDIERYLSMLINHEIIYRDSAFITANITANSQM